VTVRILYVGASGRSGSTLVDRMIGQLPGFVSVGELRVISRAGLRENRLCGCGEQFFACPFWTSVGEHAFGGWKAVDPRALDESGASTYATTLREMLRNRSVAHSDGRTELIRRLYEGIALATDGATIIDSSKGPRYAALLSGVPGLDVKVVHLIRDSRGVAYSWSKTVARPDVRGEVVEMLRMNAFQAAARWMTHNAMLELLGRATSVVRLRYEDLLTDPRAELTRMLTALGMAPGGDAFSFIGDSAVRLRPNHTVMGNPMRMQHGEVPLKVDDAWRSSMSARARALVTAMTWPLLLRYGYPMR
jgi:hypothetical protein